MITQIAAFELRTALRTPVTYIYLTVYTLLSAIWTLAYVGVVPGMDISFGSVKLMVNSPYVLNQVIALVSLFGVFTVAGIMGRAGAKDFLYQTDAFIFSKPISRMAYLGGRFLGAYAVLLFIFAGVPLGAWAAVHCGLATPDMIGIESPRSYLTPLLLSVGPNLFAGGAFFFCLTALTRRMTAVYVGSVVLLLGWLIASGFSPDSGSAEPILHAMLDPTGIFASDRQTLYWSVVEKNQKMMTLSGIYLWNRLLWVAFGTCCLALTYRFFSTSPATAGTDRKRGLPDAPVPTTLARLMVSPTFNPAAFRLMWTRMVRFELRATLANRFFGAILTCGVLFIVMNSFEIGQLMGTHSYPVTYLVLEKVRDGFGFIILIMVAFYSGEIVHRERDVGMAQIYDALPTPNWVPFTAKLVSLGVLVLALLCVVLLSGVTIQLLQGWTELNLPLYVTDLLVIQYSRMLMLCVLAMFLHVLLNHKQLGHLAMILYFIANVAVLNQGIAHPLFLFSWAPGVPWSDMNGYGAALLPHLAYKLYWFLFCVGPILLSLALWTRGTSLSLTARLRRLRQNPGVLKAMAGVTVLWLAYGAFLYHQDQQAEIPFETRHTRMGKTAALEQQFGDYRTRPSFALDHADFKIDLFAARGQLNMAATYTLENRHKQPLDQVMISAGRYLTFSELAPTADHEREVYRPDLGFYVFKLAEPVAPGGITTLSFAYTFQRPWIPAYHGNYQLYRNGSFLERGFFPKIGFPVERLLASEHARQQFQLPPLPELPEPDHPDAALRSGLEGDTTRTSLSAVISTDKEQTPMFPAPLVASYEEGGRRMARFDTGTDKVLFIPAVVSANYDVTRDSWRDVDLEIYYHPAHNRNIQRMMRGLKDSLAYCTDAFGPYPHNYLRILEFPRHKRVARSLTGTIPFSEALGFIAEVDESDPEAIDYPYFVTAHEAAHQWWPHQVMPADAKGSNLLSESLAQYTALKILEKEVGMDHMMPMLRYQRHMYLTERAQADHEEPTLLHAVDEDYVYYYKGGLILYTLANRIGEDRMNEALRRYLAEFGGREDRFPLSTDLVRLLREVTPAAHHSFIEDSFEHITFHDLRVLSAKARDLPNGAGELVVKVMAGKLRANGQSEETTVPMNDEVTFAFLDKTGQILDTRRVWVQDGEQEFVFSVDGEAVEVIIDPFYGAMDRVLDDNSAAISQD